MSAPVREPSRADSPPAITGASVRPGDRNFRFLTTWSGILVLVILATIAAFLVWKSIPSLTTDSVNPLTYQAWAPDADPPAWGMSVLIFGTLWTSVIAMVIAVPIGIGAALFIAFYAPPRLATGLGFFVDLLAAVPSIIFGLWGLYNFMPQVVPFSEWLATYLGWIPIFSNEKELYTKSIMIAGMVLAIMILPTVSAISREVFLQVPKGHIEAALALGATRWEMVRMAVFPFSRPGMISAAMLGLGRALGETIAVALILSAVFEINWQITEPGGNSVAPNIALKWGEAGANGRSALIATGLILFFITLIVNMTARWMVNRRKDFSGAN
ncbi:MAG: phosphate ABC transporter permease subunit PstC [Actinomycetales bacterium]|nr:phosphate ABC transporter permease subunit PstC [Actinomycetales bacterium]